MLTTFGFCGGASDKSRAYEKGHSMAMGNRASVWRGSHCSETSFVSEFPCRICHTTGHCVFLLKNVDGLPGCNELDPYMLVSTREA